AVGLRTRDRLGPDMLAAAGAVLDHHRLTEAHRQLLADDAGQDVGGPARRQRHDDLDRPARKIGLSERKNGRKPHPRKDDQNSAGVSHGSILMPASAMIGRNFSVSALIIAAVWAGDEPTDVKPASLMRFATSGSLSVSAIACESLSAICGG